MKHVSARCVALLCVAACATVAAVEVWPAARHVRTEDQNGDGRPDVWRRYDNRGQLTEVNVDSNFDGSPDIEEYYERGVLVRRESDRNFDGQTDLIEEFDAETHGQTRSVVDIDFDGTADLLVLFQDGLPVFSKRTRPLKRSGNPTPGLPPVHQDDAGHLARLMDPFESDTAVRGTQTAWSTEGCVGLSTTGGLPCPRVTAVGGMSASARFVARDLEPDALKLLLHRSPRAPPSPRSSFSTSPNPTAARRARS
jgi:hypothetical protein